MKRGGGEEEEVEEAMVEVKEEEKEGEKEEGALQIIMQLGGDHRLRFTPANSEGRGFKFKLKSVTAAVRGESLALSKWSLTSILENHLYFHHPNNPSTLCVYRLKLAR